MGSSDPDPRVGDPTAASTRPLPATDVMAPAGRPPVAPPPVAPPPVAPPPDHQSAMPSLVQTGAGDRCANCTAPLAPDQRYCLECGERRGQARFASAPPVPVTTTTTTTRGGPTSGGSRLSPAATLIAGVATLLLAMGIGVLIGDQNNSNQVASTPKVQVVNVGGGGSAATGSTAAQTNSSPSSGSGKSGKSSGSKHAAKSNVSNSNNNAFGGVKTVQKLPPPTVTVGAKGSGAGYQHGHFTGNFFGGG